MSDENDDAGRPQDALEEASEGLGADEKERRALDALLADLAHAVPSRRPPPALKQRIFQDLGLDLPESGDEGDPAGGADGAADRVQVWRRWRDLADPERPLLVRADAGAFEACAVPGIEVRPLSVDQARDRVVMLIRMAPGARYPSHRHRGVEECYVLQGDLRHDEQVMRAGDYERVPEGSRHGPQWTEEGCLLLVTSSRHDELLETP